jgi:hypothetical protein
MTNVELLKFFINLDPETQEQKKLKSEAIKMLTGVSESVVLYFHDLPFDLVEGKLSEDVYAHYSHWCSRKNYKIASRAVVGKYIKETYQVEAKKEWFDVDYYTDDYGVIKATRKLKTVYRWR